MLLGILALKLFPAYREKLIEVGVGHGILSIRMSYRFIGGNLLFSNIFHIARALTVHERFRGIARTSLHLIKCVKPYEGYMLMLNDISTTFKSAMRWMGRRASTIKAAMVKLFTADSRLVSARMKNGLVYACLLGVISTSAGALGCGGSYGGYYAPPPVYYSDPYSRVFPVYDGYIGPAFIVIYRNGRPFRQQVDQTFINQRTINRQPRANPAPRPQPIAVPGPQPTVAPRPAPTVAPPVVASKRQPAGNQHRNKNGQPKPQ